jgi:hypothetical protein
LSKYVSTLITSGALVALAFGFSEIAQAQEPAMKTGPLVGEEIPAFQLTDQTGAVQTFESVRGPKGLLLVFHRSADW